MAKDPRSYEVAVEDDGKRYVGQYSISGGVLTVRFHFLSESTQLGEMTAETLSRVLLRELIGKAKEQAAAGKLPPLP